MTSKSDQMRNFKRFLKSKGSEVKYAWRSAALRMLTTLKYLGDVDPKSLYGDKFYIFRRLRVYGLVRISASDFGTSRTSKYAYLTPEGEMICDEIGL